MITDEWRLKAKCRGLDPALFFPDDHSRRYPDKALLEEVCSGCTVRDQCLDDALATSEDGWYGGTNSKIRKQLCTYRRSENWNEKAGMSILQVATTLAGVN